MVLAGVDSFAQGAGSEPTPSAAVSATVPPTPEMLASQRAAGRQLQLQLENALRQKLPRVVIPPGTYRVSPESPNAPHLELKNVSNLELVAEGVTVVCETKNTALVLTRCQNVAIRGLTIDYDPLTMTQGTITAVTPTSLDFTIHAGYDDPDYDGKGVGHIWVLDGATRQVRPGSMNYGGPKQMVPLGDHAFRLVTRFARHDTVQVGDFLKIPQRMNLNSPHAVRLLACTGVDFENVTIEAAPCFGFVSSWGDDIHLTNVRVLPGPPPPGATEPRLFSSSADGINFENDQRGPVIHHCLVDSNGDDGIAIYNTPDLILGGQDASILVSLLTFNGANEVYAPGDTLRLFLHPSKSIEERKILSVLPGPAAAEVDRLKAQIPGSARNRYGRTLRVVLDSPLAVAAGDFVLNTRYAGKGFDISDNVLVNNASRGITVNESYGRVTHNQISHSFLPGIHMTEFIKNGGSPFQTSVEIADNSLSDTCVAFPQRQDWQGAISIVAGDRAAFPDGNSHLTISGNTIDHRNGIGIQVMGASQITLRDNIIGSFQDRDGAAVRLGGAPIVLNGVQGAELRHNILTGPAGPAGESEIQALPNCTGVSAEPLIRVTSSAP